MSSYAQVTELTERLDWTLDDDELRIAATVLEDLSNEARHYGRDWDVVTAPAMVKTIVLRAAVRYMRNPEGYIQSRAGDETTIWSDTGEPGGAPSLNDDERTLLASLAGRAAKAFGSVGTTAFGPSARRRRRSDYIYDDDGSLGYVPTPGGNPFPLYNDPASPW